MEGFGKLQKIRNGESIDKEEIKPSASAVLGMVGPHGREKTFDNLPLHIQNWYMENKKKRCNGG